MSNYRFAVDADGTITRGRAYRLPSDWTTDAWSNYFDGDDFVGFYDEFRDGLRTLNRSEDSWRAIGAYKTAKDYGQDPHEALRKVAQRITGNWNADFTGVELDRGMDFYVMTWGGENPEWRDEIEALNNGDIWRIEVEEFDPRTPGSPYAGDWTPADEYPEEFYGEDKATAEFERVFPLAEFPAEMLVEVSA